MFALKSAMKTSTGKPRVTMHISKTVAESSPEATMESASISKGGKRSLGEWFRHFAAWTSAAAGSPWTFICATLFLILWAFSYPLFLGTKDPFDTWQLVINTVTTIVTFLMVF